MADGREIIALGNGHYAVLDVAMAWHNAGRPRINDSWRSYRDQKNAWNNSPVMGGSGSPADNPDDPDNYALGHMRAAALDITPSGDRAQRLYGAGLIRPFAWESWHFAPPNIYYYPPVFVLPANVRHIDDITGQPAVVATLRRRRIEG